MGIKSCGVMLVFEVINFNNISKFILLIALHSLDRKKSRCYGL